MTKGLIFDYGGTLDTNGRHWASVLWDAYQQHQVTVSKDLFSKAYHYGERTLAIKPIIKANHTFMEVLLLKVEQQFDFLLNNGVNLDSRYIPLIANTCLQTARSTTQAAGRILSQLSSEYPMVIVSNFYGNLECVLKDFGLHHYFKKIIESAVVGVRKPDPAIYQLGVEAIGLLPDECAVIGDSYSKDMLPATTVGCKTVWLNVEGWQESGVDEYGIVDLEIDDLNKLRSALQKLHQYD